MTSFSAASGAATGVAARPRAVAAARFAVASLNARDDALVPDAPQRRLLGRDAQRLGDGDVSIRGGGRPVRGRGRRVDSEGRLRETDRADDIEAAGAAARARGLAAPRDQTRVGRDDRDREVGAVMHEVADVARDAVVRALVRAREDDAQRVSRREALRGHAVVDVQHAVARLGERLHLLLEALRREAERRLASDVVAVHEDQVRLRQREVVFSLKLRPHPGGRPRPPGRAERRGGGGEA